MEIGMAVSETTALSSQVRTPGTQRRSVLPLVGLGLAAMVNAAWIGFLGYCLLKLV
jgi:hypothetical protein